MMTIEELIAAAKADGSFYENAWVTEEGNVEVAEYSDLTLPELFAEADRIGRQYQTDAEIEEIERELIQRWS